MKKIKLDEKNKISSPFKVPENYFDQLNNEILSKTVEAERKPVMQLWMTPVRMSIAAAVTLLLAVSAILYFNTDNDTPEDLLAEVSTDDIILYLSNSNIDEHELLNEIDERGYSLDWEESTPLDELELDENLLDEYLQDLDIIETI